MEGLYSYALRSGTNEATFLIKSGIDLYCPNMPHGSREEVAIVFDNPAPLSLQSAANIVAWVVSKALRVKNWSIWRFL